MSVADRIREQIARLEVELAQMREEGHTDQADFEIIKWDIRDLRRLLDDQG